MMNRLQTLLSKSTCAATPRVAQSAEAFLSKLFACAYSNASVAVMSGNPADHLVHRHTHRVVRAGPYTRSIFGST